MKNLPYTLTPDARDDLANIAHYTKKTWGKEQAMKYAKLLDMGFQKIADNAVTEKTRFSKR